MDLKSFRAHIGPACLSSLDTKKMVFFVLVPLVPSCAVGDVDRREVIQVPTKIFCPSVSFLRPSTLCVLFDGRFCVRARCFASDLSPTRVRWEDRHVCVTTEDKHMTAGWCSACRLTECASGWIVCRVLTLTLETIRPLRMRFA